MKATYTQKNYSKTQILRDFLSESWDIHNQATFKGAKYAKQRKIQRNCTAFWFVTSAISMLLAFSIPFQGMMYGFSSVLKHWTVDTEAQFLMDGILFDLGCGIKDLLIADTGFGRFMDAINQFDALQAILVILCTVTFFAAWAFLNRTTHIFLYRFGLKKMFKRASR